jgi:hypothetical protein
MKLCENVVCLNMVHDDEDLCDECIEEMGREIEEFTPEEMEDAEMDLVELMERFG